MVFALVCVVLLAQAVSFNTATTIYNQNATAGYPFGQEDSTNGLLQDQGLVLAGHGLQDNESYQIRDLRFLRGQPESNGDGHPETSTLTKRIPPLPFIDNTYKQAKKKGQNLLCAL